MFKLSFGSATITDWESFLNKWWFDTHRPKLPGRGPTSIYEDKYEWFDQPIEIRPPYASTDPYIPQPPVTPIVP